MIKKISIICVLLLSACNYKIVKDESYISTDKFRDAAYQICLDSKKYKIEPRSERKTICHKDAQEFITTAEKKYRDYKADEHNYRLCRSKFPSMQLTDKCFREKQEKYYKRELERYKANLNG